jgi:predicted enzyme related to lactoylglutathione lyase
VLVYVDVADVDAAIARAQELGAPIYLDKMEIPTVGWMAIFGDPGGNRIAVMQRMPPA